MEEIKKGDDRINFNLGQFLFRELRNNLDWDLHMDIQLNLYNPINSEVYWGVNLELIDMVIYDLG